MTSSMIYKRPLHVHLTSSTSKSFVEKYGFMERIKRLRLRQKDISNNAHEHFYFPTV